MTSHIGNQPLQTIQFVFIRFVNLFHDDDALRGAKLLTVRSEVIQYLRFLKLHKRTGVSIRYFARGCRIRDYDLNLKSKYRKRVEQQKEEIVRWKKERERK